MENTYWLRYFLMCNKLASEMCACRGWQVDNFAKLIEENRIGNEQMIVYFHAADRVMAEFTANDCEVLFDMLEYDGISISDLAELDSETIENMTNEYCTITL